MHTTKAITPQQRLHGREHASILNALRGEVWLYAAEIAALADIPESHETCPRTRGYIRELVERGYPIISGPWGYCWTKDNRAVYAHIQSLRKRRDALDARIDALTKHALGA